MAASTGNKISASDINEKNSLEVGIVKWFTYSASQSQTRALVCNGQTVSRTTYSDLFAKIGTTYGSGDGSTTFNLPNLTSGNRFIQSASTPSATEYEAKLPVREGTWYGISGGGSGTGVFSYTQTGSHSTSKSSHYYMVGGTFTFTASSGNSAYSGSTAQPNAMYLIPMIRY